MHLSNASTDAQLQAIVRAAGGEQQQQASHEGGFGPGGGRGCGHDMRLQPFVLAKVRGVPCAVSRRLGLRANPSNFMAIDSNILAQKWI